MEWAKAKNVLIAIFLILNIFLGVNLTLFYREDSAQGKNTVSAVKILSDRGVVLKCEISELRDSYRISYQNAELDINSIGSILMNGGNTSADKFNIGIRTSKDSKSIIFHDSSYFTYQDAKPNGKLDLSDKEKIIKYCARFLDNLKLPISEYFLDSYKLQADGTIKLIFMEKNKDYIIFGNEFQFEVSDSGITKLECKLVKVEDGQNYKEIKIVPAYQILLRHYLHSKSVIVGIDIGFDCKNIEQGLSTSTSPVWRVRTQDGSQRFFSAMDGSDQNKM